MDILYRLSLFAYPADFRRRYGAAMLELYRIRQRRAARRPDRRPRLTALAAAVGDSLRNGLDERLGRSAIYRPGASPTPPPHPGGASMLRMILEETRHAVRRLLRAPAFSIASILVLAVGIGANTALFSIVSAVMLRPQPFANPDNLVDVYQDSDDGEPNSSSFPAYRDMSAQESIFAEATAMASFSATLQLEDTGRTVQTEITPSNYFDVLGVPLQRGAGFGAEHDSQGGPPAAIVSDASWRTLFAADPDVVGTSVRLNGSSVTVVGVAARGYAGMVPGLQQDFFVSLSAMSPIWGPYVGGTLDRRADHWFMVKARLAEGVTPAEAQAAMDVLADRLAREYPEFNEGRDITVFAPGEIRIHPDADGELLPASMGIMTIAGLLLLLVCSNVANLFLVRATSRNDEVTLRLALGAPRSRIVTHALSESILLSLTGGALGVFGATFVMRAVESGTIPLPMPGRVDLRLDLQVLGFSALLAIAAGLLFGGFPGLRLAGSRASAALRTGSTNVAGRKAIRWTRNVLVGAQVAVSFVILTVATLFAQGLANASSIDIGVGATEVAILRTDASHAGYDNTERFAVYQRLRDRVATLPSVESAALAVSLPVGGSGGSSTLVIDGYQPPSGTGSIEVLRTTVGTSYFDTMQIPLLYGRVFEDADADAEAPMVLVSRAMAETFWGRTDVVGERIRFQGSETTAAIVGVLEDVKNEELGEPPTPLFYTAMSRSGAAGVYLLARTRTEAAAALPTLRTELHAIDSELPVLQLTTLREHVADSLALPRTGARALAAFGALGLLLAGIGLYAVVAFAVQRRSRELGIRIALGAGASNVVRMVLREMLLVTGIALAIGWLAATAAAPALASGLIGVDGLDATTILVTIALLAGTAALASWVPARRAAHVDPVTALREE